MLTGLNKVIVVFLDPSRQMLGYYLHLVHDYFLSTPLKFTKHGLTLTLFNINQSLHH